MADRTGPLLHRLNGSFCSRAGKLRQLRLSCKKVYAALSGWSVRVSVARCLTLSPLFERGNHQRRNENPNSKGTNRENEERPSTGTIQLELGRVRKASPRQGLDEVRARGWTVVSMKND